MRKEIKWERNRNVEKLETLRKLKLGFWSDEKRKKVKKEQKRRKARNTQKAQTGILIWWEKKESGKLEAEKRKGIIIQK